MKIIQTNPELKQYIPDHGYIDGIERELSIHQKVLKNTFL